MKRRYAARLRGFVPNYQRVDYEPPRRPPPGMNAQ
jgi:hypothetical protein